MKTLELHVPEQIASKIEAAAHARGVSVDELVLASLQEKFDREAAFEAAAKYVLSKNQELYDRLS